VKSLSLDYRIQVVIAEYLWKGTQTQINHKEDFLFFWSFNVSRADVSRKSGKGNYTSEDINEKAECERNFRYKM
jgi:hypothetical protein